MERNSRHAGKYDELGTNITKKCEQARLELDRIKPWSKTTTERDKSEDSEGTGTEAESTTKLQVVMSLPGVRDRIVHDNAGTDTSWLTVDKNRCQVLDISAMYVKVASNVKMKQELFADPDTMDANVELYNVNGYDGLINSD